MNQPTACQPRLLPGRRAHEHHSPPDAAGPRGPAPAVNPLWYARIHGKRVPLKVTDKKIAERKARELERQMEFGHDPALLDKARRRPIAEHLLDFEESLRAKGCSVGHLDTLMARLRKLMEGCRISTLADVNPSAIESWLARRQRDEGMSAQTRKHYAVHALQLGRWLAQPPAWPRKIRSRA